MVQCCYLLLELAEEKKLGLPPSPLMGSVRETLHLGPRLKNTRAIGSELEITRPLGPDLEITEALGLEIAGALGPELGH